MHIANIEQQCTSLPFHEGVAPLAGAPACRSLEGATRYPRAGVPLVGKWEDKA
jgi:hypothetical protein